MNEKLLQIVKKSKGVFLNIGLTDEKLLDAIEENDNIHTCYLLSNASLTGKKFNAIGFHRNKKINIKKLKKYFKKKSIDTVICNYQTIKQFKRSFIPNSIYINKKTLYIYGNKNELNEISNKYKRYTNNIKLIELDNEAILKIDNTNTKNNFFKDIFYKTKDFISDSLDFITELLIN